MTSFATRDRKDSHKQVTQNINREQTRLDIRPFVDVTNLVVWCHLCILLISRQMSKHKCAETFLLIHKAPAALNNITTLSLFSGWVPGSDGQPALAGWASHHTRCSVVCLDNEPATCKSIKRSPRVNNGLFAIIRFKMRWIRDDLERLTHMGFLFWLCGVSQAGCFIPVLRSKQLKS